MTYDGWELAMLIMFAGLVVTIVFGSIAFTSDGSIHRASDWRFAGDPPREEIPMGVCGDRYETQPCVNTKIPAEVYAGSYGYSPANYTCKYNGACYKENCTDNGDGWMYCERCMVDCKTRGV